MTSLVQVLLYQQETKGQYVITNSQRRRKLFKLETVTSGVTQGSVLCPLLFISYVNDVLLGIHYEAKPVICADDTNILLTAGSTEELKTKISSTSMIVWL
jgi:hypothetical protein